MVRLPVPVSAWGAARTAAWMVWQPRAALREGRTRLRKPLVKAALRYQEAAAHGANGARLVAIRAGIAALALSLILWISIFIYVAFYYTYMPSITHTRPIYFQFRSCDEDRGICSYPSAHVRLTKRQQLLMVGQAYRISIDLDVPESQVNKDLGMFMCCAELRARGGGLVSSACRSGLLSYKSPLLTLISTLFKAPMMVLGMQEERQLIQLELFSHYEDDKNQPITDMYVEIQSRHIELYSATLNIDAHFTGLRYVMFNWPYLSAAVGVTTNVLFMALVFALSWYHLQLETDEEETLKGEDKPFGGGTENFIFDSDDLAPDTFSVKQEDESHTSEDISIVEDSMTEYDKVITVED
ncbi:lipid droplet biogenesis associated protein seipin [Arctopsyche grandis]|uniref:lipid droplet biogenesis associated protein seipin n=1 Tax=Arctopsyche grandis TaxID=121162 RepID=UPI00406D86E4